MMFVHRHLKFTSLKYMYRQGNVFHIKINSFDSRTLLFLLLGHISQSYDSQQLVYVHRRESSVNKFTFLSLFENYKANCHRFNLVLSISWTRGK